MGWFGKSKYKKFKEAKQINREEILSLYKSGDYTGTLFCIERYIETYGIFTISSYNPENFEEYHEVENEMRKEGRRFLLDTEIIELKINCMHICQFPKKYALLFLSECQYESKEKLLTTNDMRDPRWYPSRGLSNEDYQQDESFIRRCTSEVSIWVDPKPNAEDIVSKETLKELGRDDETIQLDPEDSAAWNNKGSEFHSLKKYEEAIVCYDNAIKLDPKNLDAWNGKGRSLYLLEKYEEAIVCYDMQFQLDPKNSATWYGKGNALSALKKYEEAIACYDNAIRLNPEYDDIWNAKGNALSALEKYEESLTCYNEVNKLDPKNSYAWYKTARELFFLERYEESIECCDEAIRIDPEINFVWNGKGNSLRKLGRDEEAKQCFAKAKELDES